MSNKSEIKKFQETIWDFYLKNKRDLPWRPNTKRKINPYHVLVSEFMLQQTQVDRVIPKYHLFLKKFPTLVSLSSASDKDVLSVWSGLGYNRRAIYLRNTAREIILRHSSVIPKSSLLLKQFQGIGEYMAHVLPVFVYSKRELLIETNIRSVYFYHFFSSKNTVSDKEIFQILEETVPRKNVRDWYYALMDYGTYLKKEKKVTNRKSSHYAAQKPFKGSLRFVRGQLLKCLLNQKILKTEVYDLFKDYTSKEIETVCDDLLKERMIKESKKYFYV